jgi:NlpC/P60 family putative phage cell wall peptidase
MIARDTIIAAAHDWIGTPYHHQASLKGVGCDCLGLIRGLWRELQGPEPEPLPPYTRDWGDATGSQPLLEAAGRHLVPTEIARALPGDVIVFRMQAGVAKHAGILTRGSLNIRAQVAQSAAAPDQASFVHAQEGIGVAEMWLTPWWRRRVSAVFRFPRVD